MTCWPRGVTGQTPDKAEAWRSGHSKENIFDNIEGARKVYADETIGANGYGIDDYAVEALNEPDLDAQIDAQFTTTLAAVQAISGTLFNTAQSAITEANELLRLIKRKLAERLNVFFGFNDDDGD